MDELFKKIYVKSEADLPGDNKKYDVFWKGNDFHRMHGWTMRRYFNDIDWYLQPIEKQIVEKKFIEDRSHEIIINDVLDDEEQESKPVYDEAYLNECIAKATPRLSKIKDVDKEMNEIKGIEEQGSADNIKNLLREYGFYGINHNEDANNKLIEALINLFNQL